MDKSTENLLRGFILSIIVGISMFVITIGVLELGLL